MRTLTVIFISTIVSAGYLEATIMGNAGWVIASLVAFFMASGWLLWRRLGSDDEYRQGMRDGRGGRRTGWPAWDGLHRAVRTSQAEAISKGTASMTHLPGIGHNSGQDLDGYSGRLHQWRRARKALLGDTLPIEVVRMRVRRAAALGLDYGTYASVRATSGRDIAALLFSSNALGMIRLAEVEAGRAAKLARVAAARGALVHAPLPPDAVAPLDWAEAAPSFADPWPAMRDRLVAALRSRGLPPDAVLLVGETAFERSWCAAMRAAGYLPGARYFDA